MAELETTELPPLNVSDNSNGWEDVTGDNEAPYGYKADGTPRQKPGRKAGSGGGSTRKVSAGSSDAKFAERISQELVELSAPLGIVSPLAVLHVAERADRTANALVIVSRKHPAVKVAIESYFNSVAYKDLALFALGIPVAIMIDMGMLRPDAVVGRVWGMESKYQTLYGDGENEGTEFYSNGNRASARGLAAEI